MNLYLDCIASGLRRRWAWKYCIAPGGRSSWAWTLRARQGWASSPPTSARSRSTPVGQRRSKMSHLRRCRTSDKLGRKVVVLQKRHAIVTIPPPQRRVHLGATITVFFIPLLQGQRHLGTGSIMTNICAIITKIICNDDQSQSCNDQSSVL
jgi:hypothetical protein